MRDLNNKDTLDTISVFKDVNEDDSIMLVFNSNKNSLRYLRGYTTTRLAYPFKYSHPLVDEVRNFMNLCEILMMKILWISLYA